MQGRPGVPLGAPRALAHARALADLLDRSIPVPGTRWRVGLDPLLGLIPGAGDLAGGALGAYVLLTAARLGAPTSLLLRMLLTLGVDALLGAVPLLGDLFDAGWKANTRNVALLERWLDRPAPTHAASRGVVVLVLLALALMVAGGVALTVLAARWLLGVVG